MTDSPRRSKLDPRSKLRLAGLRSSQAPPPAISMFLRARVPFTSQQIDDLQELGVTIRTHTGSIMTIDVPLESVERILECEFVVTAELSSPLYRESSDGR